MRLRGFHVRGTTANDTGFIAIGNTIGFGAYFKGGATNADGIRSIGIGSAHGINSIGGTTGHGIRGFASTGVGILGIASGSGGVGIFGDAPGASGIGMRAEGSAEGFKITGSSTGLLVQSAGGQAAFNAVSLIAGTAGIGLNIIGGDTAILASGSDVDVYANTGTWPSNSSGDGTYNMAYSARDTLNNAYINGVVFGLYNSGGTKIAELTTPSSGSVTWTLTENDTYYVRGYGPPLYSWEPEDTIVADHASDSLKGAKASPVSPSTGKTATVSVIVKKSTGELAVGVRVTAYLAGSNLVDSSGAAISNKPITVQTNSSGVATFQCLWSSYLIPATDWWFSTRAGVGGQKTRVTIPRQSTYTVTMSN